MLAPTKILLACLSIIAAVPAFELFHDDNGHAILPPTHLVLSHLNSLVPEVNAQDYSVLSTVHSNGEIIKVNMNTHQIKATGKFRNGYDNSCYYNKDSSNKSTKEKRKGATVLSDFSDACLNKEYDLGAGDCEIDFGSYDAATNCTTNGYSKYSCVIEIERDQNSAKLLKNMDVVACQTRCFYNLTDIASNNFTTGACGN